MVVDFLQVNRTEQAIQVARELMASVGMTMQIGGTPNKAGVVAKYRLPDGTEWSGRGRHPVKFREYLAQNPDLTIADLTIRDEPQLFPGDVAEEEMA